ncbi:protein-disulfide reductase DsbD [Sulfurospirillum multivorans]|uniref:Protein-disulfide reductase n=2 Tax=Sulfurospirillum multivorans TaxID=66821 RepID=A0AA86AP44_SULMK|nr:protein-disulfide reductase DsbD [Sulfurospirillum multivorans]AHJ13192.1 protein-disulfide reductase [Sulfurospirillum multivorans DSM 12446]QEH06680.1 protein-disulfide reductase [Sulfurospirillum multivorans]
MQHTIRFFSLFFLLVVTLFAVEKPKLLTPEEAFNVTATHSNQGVMINVTLGEKIYLYDDKISLELTQPKTLDMTQWVERPKAEYFHDTLTQRKSFELFVPQSLLDNEVKKGSFTLRFSYQGCSEMGICYQPMTKEFTFKLKGGSATPLSEQDTIAQSFMSGNSALVLLSFFGFGLLLSLTPCVFPMIPILSSIIVSQPSVSMNAKKGFWLSLVYVLAMSLAYTIAGVLAALFGANLQASMQNPWIIGVFSAIFVLLALSMFGFYELKMPSFIQNRINKKTGEAQAQGVFGIAVMGFLSALIVGPCVAAPLAGALIYIGQSGDALLGGSALFVMSLGMGVPLLLIGTTAGRYMPRPGMWMQNITAFFGVMLLGVAIWMLSRIIPSFVSMSLWAVLIISSSIYFGALESFSEQTKGWQKVLKSILFMALVYGVALLVGFLSGATNPLAPFEKFTAKEGVSASTSSTLFTKIKTIEELNLALKNAEKPVMLDFYADWCVNCVEFEQFTFSDARVKAKLEKFTLLKADVTKNSDDDKALQKAFTIYGPPAILFFKEGKEVSELRLAGFKNADEFLAHLEKVGM